MSEQADNAFADAVEAIESSYEYMLAYAAQGRDGEPEGGSGGPTIRDYLKALDVALGEVSLASDGLVARLEPARQEVAAGFQAQLSKDAHKARQAVQLVLSVPSIGSQLVDNLNASTHLRCLLTDLFLFDEAMRG